MLIETLIKPTQRPTRTVDILGRPYVFTEVPNARGRFVAEVADEDAQKVMLAHPKQFREFTDAIGPSLAKPGSAPAASTTEKAKPPVKTDPPKVDPPKTAVDPAAGNGSTNTDDEKTAAEIDAETQGKAQALLSCTPVAIKKQLDKNCPSKAVLESAIAIEAVAAKPRDHVLAALRGAASALQA